MNVARRQRHAPPRAARWLLAALLPRRARAEVLADMADEHRLLAESLGRQAADRWYRVHVGRSLIPALQMRWPFPDWRNPMDVAVGDMRQSLRRLLRAPGFAAGAVATLALGIGSTAAIFTLVDSVLLRPLPYPDAARIVAVGHSASGLDLGPVGQSWGTYVHYRDHGDAFDSFGLYQQAVVNLTGGGDPERIRIAMVTDSFFEVLGVEPALGRALTRADLAPGLGGDYVLLSDRLWRERYRGDPGILEATVQINGVERAVVGVLPPGFDFPERGIDVFMNLTEDPAAFTFGGFYLDGIARLRAGIGVQRAEAELQRLVPGLADAYADATPELLERSRLRVEMTPLKQLVIGDAATGLWALLFAVAIVLAIACANVANLFLVHAEHRTREVAVRRALGASRRALLRFFLSESLWLAAAGTAAGLAVARLTVAVLLRLAPDTLPRLHEVRLDARTILLAAAISALAALLFAVAPTLRHRRTDFLGTLRAGTRAVSGDRAERRHGELFVAAQVALAVVLLVASGLMVRSFERLARVELGFDGTDVLTAQISLPYRSYPDYASSAAFFQELLARLRATTGVTAAGAVSNLPLTASPFAEMPHLLEAEGRPRPTGEQLQLVRLKLVTAGYFEAMRIPVLAGRIDLLGATRPVILSEPLARRLFPDGEAVGRRVRRVAPDEQPPWATVAAVVGPVREQAPDRPPAEIYYVPLAESFAEPGFSPGFMTLTVRGDGPSSLWLDPLRRAVAELDSALPVSGVRSYDRILRAATARRAFTMILLAVAAAVALFLGAVGLYAVTAYGVGRRTREFGVRMALGASPAEVLRMVTFEGGGVVVLGLAVGAALALLTTRLLASLLFEVSPADPLTFLIAIALLAAVAMFATLLPARRATRVDPVRALGAD